jgi:hypothetical protein
MAWFKAQSFKHHLNKTLPPVNKIASDMPRPFIGTPVVAAPPVSQWHAPGVWRLM